jgi:hypothetical protein
VAVALSFGKTKTPPPGLAVGFVKFYVFKSEPDHHAGQQRVQQRVQQQVQIEVAIHENTLIHLFCLVTAKIVE